MSTKSWFIASGVGFGLWAFLMTATWIGDFTGFWFLLGTDMPFFFFDFGALNFRGWLVIVARVMSMLLWVFIGVSLYKGFKGLKAHPQV
jgi:hypothetical protein